MGRDAWPNGTAPALEIPTGGGKGGLGEAAGRQRQPRSRTGMPLPRDAKMGHAWRLRSVEHDLGCEQ